jgi:rubrerythrin
MSSQNDALIKLFSASVSDKDENIEELIDQAVNSLTSSNSSSNISTISNITGTVNWNGISSWSTMFGISPSQKISKEIDSINEIFHKITKHLSEEDLEKMLDAIAEEDEYHYLDCLRLVITHGSFRKLSEKFLIERISDIEKAEQEFGFKLKNIIDLDLYPSVKLLKKLS